MQIDTIFLRKWIGIFAMSLPWIVVILTGGFPASISATWYTNACTVFMIILGMASMLLMAYKGYTKFDDIILTCAGVTGLLICLFPCAVSGGVQKVGTFMVNSNISGIIHNISAIVFFILLSYNSLFLFTKTSGNMTPNKKIRNVIYRVCGVGMIISFALLLLPDFRIKVWLVETIALTFFGVSFLTKADIYPWLFCDPPQNSNPNSFVVSTRVKWFK